MIEQLNAIGARNVIQTDRQLLFAALCETFGFNTPTCPAMVYYISRDLALHNASLIVFL
jgi:hypothetical protein